jgi:hypothetical protein
LAGAVTMRGAAIVGCSLLAGACVGAFLLPVLAPAAAASATTAAVMAAGGGLGGNLLASWIDRAGPDKLTSLLTGPLSLPKHDDMVRVADLALSCALKDVLKALEPDFNSAGRAGDDLRRQLEQWKQAASTHSRLTATEADAAITTALTHLSGQTPAQALTHLLSDAITPDMRHAGDRAYMTAWRGLADRMSSRLSELLPAYMAEALKSDERFFRAVTLAQQAAMVQTGQDVLATVQAQAEQLRDLQATLTARLAQNQSQNSIADFHAAITAQLSALQSAIQVELDADRAPPLNWPQPTQQTGQELSLLYYDRKAPFVGRDAALAALNRFIDDPAPLLWTSITGGAGVGKSRLVLEALSLRRLTGGVVAGFMQPSAGWLTAKRYENWRAPVPTVLVIDYAGVSPELVRDLIDNLACRTDAQALRAPVRLLLLDTQPNQGDFALPNRIKDSTERGRRAARVEWSDADPTNLDLRPLSNTDLLTITALYREADLTSVEVGKVTAAVRADPELGRPLFAALMGLALRHGTDTALTLAGVTNHFLDRQERHWTDRDQITPLDRTLLALATLGGSVPLVDVLNDPLLADLLPTTGKPHRPTLRQHWSVMTGKPLPTDHLAKLEPDYVGGLYLLRHLKQAAPGDPREPDEVAAEVKRLITLAWKYGDPREPLINLARNFAGAAEWVGLVTELALYRPEGKKEEDWASMVPTLALAMAQRGADDAVDRLLNVLEAGTDPSDKEMLAAACFASGLAGELGIHPRADDRLIRLRKLIAASPGNADIALPLAKGLINAVYHAGTDTGRADRLLGELRTLVDDHRGNTDVALHLAMGLFNAVYHAGADAGRIDRLLGELRTLVDDHRGKADIALALAKGLFNAVCDARTEAGRVDRVLGELRTLVADHRGNADIALLLAMGLFNATKKAGTDTGRVDRLLGELRTLVADHRGNTDIALHLAMGLVNATNNAKTDVVGMDRLLGELRTLVDDHRGNADIVLHLALGLVNATDHAGTDTGRVDRLLRELRTLVADHRGNADIALRLAMGLVNATNNAGTDTGRLDRLLDELRTLVDDHRDNADIALELAKGLFNASNNAGTDTGRVDRLLGELRTLVDDHRANGDIALPLAKSLTNAVYHAGADAGRVDRLLRELRTLVADHWGNADIALLLAMGLVNAVSDAGTDTGRVDRVLGELRTLVADHRGNANIALHLAMGLVNATNNPGTDTGRLDRVLGDLRTLVADHRGNTDIALHLAIGLFNATNNPGTDTGRLDRVLGELRTLVADHNGNCDIALRLAKGLVKATNHAGTDTGRVDRLLGELRTLVADHRGNADIALQLAMSLVGGLYDGLGDDAVLIEELSGLALAHPEVELIRNAPRAAQQIIAQRRGGLGGAT